MGIFRLFRSFGLSACLVAPVLACTELLAQAPVPSPPPSAARPKTDIDNFSGILFYCKPLAQHAWTQAWCADMGSEMTSWAARASKPIALLNTSDTREKNDEKARAAGFDPKHGLWVLLRVDPRTSAPAGWDLAIRADGIAAGQPVNVPSQTTTYSKSELLGASIAPNEATARGRRILGTIMTALTVPMRPL
jgi:hypothetical protein